MNNILSKTRIQKYYRHVLLGDIGQEGQKKLLDSKVLIIGAGGLGSPCALYLAGAGIGNIGIVDFDKVEIHNLHRQILYTIDDIGKNKADIAQKKLSSINDDVKVVSHILKVDNKNISSLIEDYDFVVDASDNFKTKYLINDTCVKFKKPFSHAGVFEYQGQLMTIIPGKSACFRCVFSENEFTDSASSHQNGILGTACATIGVLQANEVLKFFLGIGSLMTGKLLIFNCLDSSIRHVSVAKNNKCSVCRAIT